MPASPTSDQPSSGNASPSSDERIEQRLGQLLRAGVILSALVVLAGGAIFLTQRATLLPHYQTFDPGRSELRSIGGTIRLATQLDGRGLIQLGLLLLIATPVARVAMSLVIFAWLRDWRYVGVTTVVFCVLCYGMVSGYQAQKQAIDPNPAADPAPEQPPKAAWPAG